MVTTKRCSYGTCKNDSRYPKSWERNPNGDLVKFFHFPVAVRQNERRQRWLNACHRGDSFMCTKECLEMIYSEVKDKSQRMNMWKSLQKTKAEKLKGKYLKVSLMSYLFSFIVEEGSTQICYYTSEIAPLII